MWVPSSVIVKQESQRDSIVIYYTLIFIHLIANAYNIKGLQIGQVYVLSDQMVCFLYFVFFVNGNTLKY